MAGKMKLFSVTSERPLATKIADYLDIPLCEVELQKFSDGEVKINIEESIRGTNAYVVQSMNSNVNERKLIKRLSEQHKPVFGVCLGAQQIAATFGSEVTVNKEKEVGWFPVKRTSDKLSFFPESLNVFHWHQDTFALPAGATRLFASEGCLNQAFLYGENIIGLQFHFEMEKAGIETILRIDEAFITSGKYVQSVEVMREKDVPEDNKQMLEAILDYLINPKTI